MPRPRRDVPMGRMHTHTGRRRRRREVSSDAVVVPGTDPLLVRILNRVPGSVSASFASTSRRAQLLRPLVNRLVPSRETEVTVRAGAAEGLRLVIDPRREKYYWTGAYE